MKLNITLSIIILFTTLNLVVCQSISVIQMKGDAYAVSSNDGKEIYSKIVFGPLNSAEQIILKENATLRLINEEKQILDLSDEGSYNVKELTFEALAENSVFNKFCDYFHSFFVNHSSAESKANYRNSIYAISRGNVPPPFLDFPLSGDMPITKSPIPFIWTHSCESCEYVVNIYNYATRTPVYAWTTDQNRVELDDPMHYLKANTKYYWTVTISGTEMEYKTNIFTTSNMDDYDKKVSAIESTLTKSGVETSVVTKTIFVLSELEAEGYSNYAIYYGLQRLKENPEDLLLANYIERFWYDSLLTE